MAEPIPYVATETGAESAAPEGSIPIALYGTGTPVAQAAGQANLAGGATLADVITAHNALLAKLRTARVIAPTPA